MPETTGGNITALPSSGSPSPSQQSSGSPSRSAALAVSQNLLSWATFGVIGYAWLFTEKLNAAPWYGPSGFLVLNALPGGMIVEIVKTVVVVVAERLPLRSVPK